MSKTRSSVIFSSLAKFGSIAAGLVLVVVVARWLRAEEIGAFAVAYGIYMLLEPLRQLQIISFVIQAPEIDRPLMRSVNYVGWLTTGLVLTIALGTGLLLIGPIDSPEVGRLLMIMAAAFVCNTMAQPALALLRRDLRYDLTASVELVGAITKVVVTIAGLFLGLRAEALALGIVSEVALRLVLLAKIERQYAFTLPSRARAGEIWAFCLRFAGADLVNRGSTAVTEVVIGSFLGLAAAGIYNRANVLTKHVRSGIERAITPVALSAFARSSREKDGQVVRDYLVGLSYLTGITWAGLALFIAIAEPLILTVYGERWEATVPLAQIVGIGAIIHAMTAMAPSLLAATGRVQSLLVRNVAVAVPRLAILFGAAQFDLTIVAWGLTASMLIHFAVNQALLNREVGLTLSDLFRALWRSGLVASASGLAAFLTLRIPEVAGQPLAAQLAIALVPAALVWLITVFATGHPLRDELFRVASKLKKMRGVRPV